MNDQAEQVFLGLARGAGAKSLSGMRKERGYVLRPLLDVSSDDIKDAVKTWNLQPWNDPQNEHECYARVKVRKNVLPVIEEQLGAGTIRNLARSAQLIQEEVEALDFFITRKQQ